MTADAYATAFMAMGLEKSKEMAKGFPELHYYFIYQKPDGTTGIEYSDGFEQFSPIDSMRCIGSSAEYLSSSKTSHDDEYR